MLIIKDFPEKRGAWQAEDQMVIILNSNSYLGMFFQKCCEKLRELLASYYYFCYIAFTEYIN